MGVGRFFGWVVRFDDVALAATVAAQRWRQRPWRPSRPWSALGDGVLRPASSRRGLGEEAATTATAVAVGLGQFAGLLAGALGLAPERLVVPVEALGDVELLGDAQDRLGDVVDDQTEQEEHLEDGEGDRQVLHQLLLAGRHLGLTAARAATIRCWTK